MRKHSLLIKSTVVTTALLATLVLTACGRPNKQVAATGAPTGSKDELDGEIPAAVPCTKKECPPASMDASSPGFASNGQLVGFKGEPVPWEFTGVDVNDPSRQVGILLDDIPSGSDVSPKPDGKKVETVVTLEWTPNDKMVSTTPLKIIVRDLDRCLMKEKDESKCHTNKALKSYDDTIAVKWEIVDRAELENVAAQAEASVGQANCDAAKAAQKNAMTGQMVTGGISVLLNPAAASSVLANMAGGLIMNQINKPAVPGC